MCKFCRKSCVDADYLEKELFSDNLDFGFAGVVYITGDIDLSTKSLRFSLIKENGDAKEYRKEIAFCPFCGEHLSGMVI